MFTRLLTHTYREKKRDPLFFPLTLLFSKKEGEKVGGGGARKRKNYDLAIREKKSIQCDIYRCDMLSDFLVDKHFQLFIVYYVLVNQVEKKQIYITTIVLLLPVSLFER